MLALSTAPYTHNSMQLVLLESLNTSVSVHMRITGRAAIQTSTHCGDINFTEPRHRDVFLLSHIAGSATIRVPADRGALTQLTSIHFPCIVASCCPRILRGVLQYECPQIAALSLQFTSIYFPRIGTSRRSRILGCLLQYGCPQIAALSLQFTSIHSRLSMYSDGLAALAYRGMC